MDLQHEGTTSTRTHEEASKWAMDEATIPSAISFVRRCVLRGSVLQPYSRSSRMRRRPFGDRAGLPAPGAPRPPPAGAGHVPGLAALAAAADPDPQPAGAGVACAAGGAARAGAGRRPPDHAAEQAGAG